MWDQGEAPIRKTRVAWNEVGHAHFVTFSCRNRWPLLAQDRSRRWVLDAMQRVRAEHDVALWAYVVMPEHVHILLCPRRPRYEMRTILAALKRPVAAVARAHLLHTGQARWLERLTVTYPSRVVFRFWQPGGGYDHNVFRAKTLPAIIDYIHANPVRRGLVESPTQWVWSSARFWAGCPDALLAMDQPGD